MSLIKAPLPKNSILQEVGERNTADTSTEQNPRALIQLWISFNCQNLSDENDPLGSSLSDDFFFSSSSLFLHQHSVQNIKHNYNKKKLKNI